VDTRALQNWTRHELALRAAEMALSALEKRAVRAIPVKGLILGRGVYDPVERPIADVDLILRAADFPALVETARDEGWPLVWDSKLVQSVNFLVESVAIDVMGSFGPPGVAATPMSTILARARRARDPLGFLHWQIEHHDHALLLAIDAFKDKLGAGKPWAAEDLLRIAAEDRFRPATLVQRAGEARLHTMLTIVADWLLASNQSPAWTEVRRLLGPRPPRPRYAEYYRCHLRVRSRSTLHSWYLAALTRAVSDAPWLQAYALALGAIGAARFLTRHGSLRADVWRPHRSVPSAGR
jgi:hypothetical protein